MEPIGPNFGRGPPWTIFPAMASGNQLSKHSPQFKGNSSIPPCTLYSRLQGWCIYGIIYHYAPFLLSNSMVTFSGPNSTIPTQGPKIQCPFQRRTFQLISLAIHGCNQKTIQGSQSPGPAGVGWQFHSGLFQGHSQRLYSLSISCQGIKYFNTPWTAQLVHTGVNQSTCMSLAQLGQFNLPLWEFNHTVQFQDGQNCIGPIQTIQPVIHLPGSVFQFFTYNGHPSAPGDVFPS
ncbi:hypothetical protein O181_097954 [Austropuccinia psidii MF-1]|uniref:Uncharacterized protein n=1 Tax=Austropuccinia psidii MF-1 TaxID=1389203 RepID=A0A9Q3J9V6_9BASI|nr:hypothetical protein [Austropuccinia psidii MF-1]